MTAARRWLRRCAVASLMIIPLVTGLGWMAITPRAEAHASVLTVRQREGLALDWAVTQAGKPYLWGGAGPYGYDCSGLVVAAFAREGISLPHSTYAMLGSRHLVRTWSPRRGDLAFFGSGHVEIVTTWHDVTFGALHSGTALGWHRWGWGWVPTMYFEVIP